MSGYWLIGGLYDGKYKSVWREYGNEPYIKEFVMKGGKRKPCKEWVTYYIQYIKCPKDYYEELPGMWFYSNLKDVSHWGDRKQKAVWNKLHRLHDEKFNNGVKSYERY